jgi:xanthine dehydrogenase FAD-binding subunit
VLVSEVHYPKDLAELLELRRRFPAALILAGGTEVMREQAGRSLVLPDTIISIRKVPELRKASLTERFLEIGAGVTLAEILELAESALPPLFALALRGIGTPALRNLATLGGNLAGAKRFMDCWPALACLEALAELRDSGGSLWMNVNRFLGPDGANHLPQGALISRIRIPIERWGAFMLKKVGQREYPGPGSAVFAFVARAEKGMLQDLRLAFAGDLGLRSRAIETGLIGRSLPLSDRERRSAAEEYRELASALPDFLALPFASLVDGALELLSK